MNNFEFQNPTKIVFGKGSIAKLKELMYKGEKIMMTYGGGSLGYRRYKADCCCR